MMTLRELLYWWHLRTGPLSRRLIYQANRQMTDPGWWVRRPTALWVHPMRALAYVSKIEAAFEVICGSDDLLRRRAGILRQWGRRKDD